MKYFMLNALGNHLNEDYCFTDNGPGPVMDDYDLRVGTRVADEYPDGIGEVLLELGEDYLGLSLTSYIGNTMAMLIVSKEATAIIQAHDVGELEVIPFKLINHKKRVHSRDYVFLNPLGSVDCLDMKKTAVSRRKDGSVRAITKFVLDRAKLKGVRHLFRPSQDLDRYIFSEAIVAALQKAGCTNFVFDELEQN